MESEKVETCPKRPGLTDSSVGGRTNSYLYAQIEDEFAVSHSAAEKNFRDLFQEGVIVKATDPDDRRHWRVSLDPKDAEAPVINALRKEVDRRQIEFVKSGKLLPVAFSSRHYDFKRQQWVFGKATDEAMPEFVERKVYWQTKLGGTSPLLANDARNGEPGRVWIGDPTEAQYLQTTPAHLIEIAARLLAAQGLLRIEGEFAEATPGLMDQADRFESARRRAMEELEKKHAFERG